MSKPLKERIDNTYKECIILALYETSGNISKASELLELNRMTFARYMKQFGLSFKEFRQFKRVNNILDGLGGLPLHKERDLDYTGGKKSRPRRFKGAK